MIADYNEIQIGASEVSGDIRKYEDVAFASFDEELFFSCFHFFLVWLETVKAELASTSLRHKHT